MVLVSLVTVIMAWFPSGERHKVQIASITVRAKMARALSNISSNGSKVFSYSGFWICNWISFRIHDLNCLMALSGWVASHFQCKENNDPVLSWIRYVYIAFFHSNLCVAYDTAFPPHILLSNPLLKTLKVVHSCNSSTQELEEDQRTAWTT